MNFRFGDVADTLSPVSGFSIAQMAFQLATEQGYTQKVGSSEYWYKNPITGDIQNFYNVASSKLNNPAYRRTGDVAVTVKDGDAAPIARIYATQEDVQALGLQQVLQLASAQARGVTPATGGGATAAASGGATSAEAAMGITPDAPAASTLPKWALPVGIAALAYFVLKGH